MNTWKQYINVNKVLILNLKKNWNRDLYYLRVAQNCAVGVSRNWGDLGITPHGRELPNSGRYNKVLQRLIGHYKKSYPDKSESLKRVLVKNDLLTT